MVEPGVHPRGGQQQTDPRCPVRAHGALSTRDPGPHGTWGGWAEGRAVPCVPVRWALPQRVPASPCRPVPHLVALGCPKAQLEAG